MALVRPNYPLRIGEYLLDPGSNELGLEGVVTRLPARLVDLLLRLAAEPGQMVRRETLIDEVWERRQVNDEVLSRAVADLRQFLGDDARAPRYIETLPKLGYRLVAAVIVAEPMIEASVPAAVESTPPPVSSVAPTPPRRQRGWWILVLTGLVLLAIWQWRQRGPQSETSAPANPLTAANLLRARPFTTDSGSEMLPRFSPDGRWVLYVRVPGAGAPASLRLRAVDGTEDRALVEDGFDNYCGVISPDGHWLAWHRARPGVCELVLRPLLGGPVRVLAGCASSVLAGCPDWSPEGRSLLLGAGTTGPTGLREVDVESGTERVLTTPTTTGSSDFMPRYSRDGVHIVFWRGDGWSRSLTEMKRVSGEVRVLQPEAWLGFGHALAADGSVLLADDSHGQRALVRLDVDGTSTLLGAANARHPDLAIDGGIVYEDTHYDANLWRVDLTAPEAEPKRLTTAVRYDGQPAHSPDGKWIAFGSNRDGREAIFLMRSDGSGERKLPLDPSLRWSNPNWSPDGNRLLLLRYEEEGARLCLYALDRASLECPTAWPLEAHAGFFLSDSEIGFVRPEGDSQPAWRAKLDGSPPRRDADEAIDRCRVVGGWMACFHANRPGLQVRDLASGATRDLLPELEFAQRGEWALSPRAIYFAARGADKEQWGIFRLDLVSGARLRVSTLLPSAVGASISVAPDESALVLARTDRVDSDLMIVPPPQP